MKLAKLRALGETMLELYTRLRIPMAAAALSYCMTMTFFPLLICLYTMLGGAFPASGEILHFLAGLLPESTIQGIMDYLHYVSDNLSTTMSVVAVTVMVTSSAAAFRTIDRVMGEMHGARRYSGVFALVFSFCFSLIFLVAIYFSVLLILTGKWFLDFVDRHLMFVNISSSWRWARFILLYLLLFVMLSGVYRITAPRGRTIRLLPGAALASGALVAVSILFSMFIGASTRYPLVYGSLASVIIMMIWMYTCGLILFLGNILNVSLDRVQARENGGVL